MRETQTFPSTDATDWMRRALHDLSQPLTALECGLYLGTMSPDGTRASTHEELLKTILEALVQAERVISQVRAMQERLNDNQQQAMETRGR